VNFGSAVPYRRQVAFYAHFCLRLSLLCFAFPASRSFVVVLCSSCWFSLETPNKIPSFQADSLSAPLKMGRSGFVFFRESVLSLDNPLCSGLAPRPSKFSCMLRFFFFHLPPWEPSPVLSVFTLSCNQRVRNPPHTRLVLVLSLFSPLSTIAAQFCISSTKFFFFLKRNSDKVLLSVGSPSWPLLHLDGILPPFPQQGISANPPLRLHLIAPHQQSHRLLSPPVNPVSSFHVHLVPKKLSSH